MHCHEYQDRPLGLGVRVYSIGYNMPGGAWSFKYSCPAIVVTQVAKLRAKAITEAARISLIDLDRPAGGFTLLAEAWFE